MASRQFENKITFVTGKGGVGKSTIAAALAMNSASEGKKTLLVEYGGPSYFSEVFSKTLSYEPYKISENLYASVWDGESCLKEYIYYLIPIKKVAELFFNNFIMRTFINAAPGLKELAILGKTTSGARHWGPAIEFDEIIVDAYSTGHFMALLRAPIGMGNLIDVGPMGEQCRNIVSVLKNKTQCKYVIVTLAEELPVTETTELRDEISKTVGQTASVYCNKIYNLPISNQALLQCQPNVFRDFLVARQEVQNEQLENLKNNVGSFVSCGLVLSPHAHDVVCKLAEELRK